MSNAKDMLRPTKDSLSKYSAYFDDLKNQYKQISDYVDTQNDILLLQGDIGEKYYGVDRDKVNIQTNLKNRLLKYNELENRSSDSMFYMLKMIFVLLVIASIIMLILKFNR